MGSIEEKRVSDILDSALFVKEDRLKGRTLRDVHTCVVTPAKATPSAQEWLPLSKLDYLWMTYYTPLLATYTVDQVRSFGTPASVVQHWKDSLAQALVAFYPLAGRLFIKDDDPPRIHCNDAGAMFTEATVDADLDELRFDDFQPLPLLSGFAPGGLPNYPDLPQTPSGLPTLIIQVTHFNCGGVTLAANWSHGVADGFSGLHFMKSWSEIARGLEISLLPDHRRDLMKPRDPPVASNIGNAAAFSPGALNAPPTTHPAAPFGGGGKIIPQMVEFTGSEIAELRKSSSLTRADCFSTHIWRTIIRARGVESGSRVRLFVLIEGRKKCGLPAGYFGNVTGMAPIISTVEELVNGPLETTASLIHAGVASVTREWFQRMVDAFATSRRLTRAPESLGPGTTCGISYLVRFPFYELDFGFGVPAQSTRNTMGSWDGLVFVVPSSRGKDHMVAFANLDPDVAAAFVTLAHDFQP